MEYRERHTQVSTNIPQAHAVKLVEAGFQPGAYIGHARGPIEWIKRI